ncbi:hypothetical protein PWT90_05427 [Aphanocladium album]|nr:hypothetical protein PWT90_05427 [Aphanocladium album]
MSARTLTFLVCLASFAGQALGSPPDITFLCDKTPQICTNMCWAIRCGEPSFNSTLTFDWPSAETKDVRRSRGGCGVGHNPCGVSRTGPGHRKAPFDSCHEYPPASTKEADDGPQVSRCVSTAEKVAHAVMMGQLQDKWKRENKTTFSIAFANLDAEGVRYCDNDSCGNDGFEVQDQTVTSRKTMPLFKLYLTRARMIIASMEELEIPTFYKREHYRYDKLDDDVPVWMENDDEHGDVRMIEDMVLDELPWNYFYG